MAGEISISLNKIQNFKTVKIEGLGILKIRKIGSGEDLDLSVKLRYMNKLIEELSSINFKGLDVKKPSDLKKIQKLTARAEELGAKVDEIRRFEFETYKRLLSDDKGGKVVDIIMNTLTDQERAEIFKIAFGEKKLVDTHDIVEMEKEHEENDDQVAS